MTLSDKTKKSLLGGAIAIVSIIVAQFFFKKPSFDQEMMAIAKEINKNCPIMVDSYTQLDNTMCYPGKIFQYNYTLIHISFDEMDVEEFIDYMEPHLITFIKTSPDMEYLRKKGTTFYYDYRDKDRKHIHKFIITPSLYK